MSEAQEIGVGQADPNDSASDFNSVEFHVRQLMAQLDTMKLVEVQAVHPGQNGAPGTVDVLPLVNQIDGNGNATPHGTVFGLPWFRLQGGVNAIVIDPVVGDIGYVVASDRDISAVKSSGAQANPGSLRKFDIADGVYVGGCLNAAPTQFIQFTDSGITIQDKNGNAIVMSANGIAVTLASGKSFALTGAFTATGEITRGLGGVDQVTLGQHEHTGANVPPTPGT
jgi:hypothetical protein